MAQAQAELRQVGGLEAPSPGTWVLDPAHSSAEFTARHLMVSKVRGRFQKFSGTILVGESPEESSVDVTIDAASITTNHEQRDAHLRSPDFLDVEKYPTLHFRSTKVVQTGDSLLKVYGELTIRDVTRPVVLDVEYEGAQKAPWGSNVVGFSARTEINREDWGITWNQALETGGWMVGKKVTIEIEVEAAPAQAQAA